MRIRHRWFRRVAWCLSLGFIAAWPASWIVGSSLVAPANHAVVLDLTGLPFEAVRIPSGSGSSLRGDFLRGKPGSGAVLLLHGVRADRASMAARARFLAAAGYSVLLIDMQAHGESPGRIISFGYLESRDARAAVDFLHGRLPGEPVGVIGSSMGGAAAVLSDPPLDIRALVLEEVYPTAREAIEDRLVIRLGPTGRYLLPLLAWQIRPRFGIGLEELRPIERVRTLSVPKLFIAAEEDRHTTLKESEALFAAAMQPKEWWLVPRAEHQDLHAFAGAEYESRVGAFLAAHLQARP